MNLSTDVKITKIAVGAAADTSAVESSVIDMQGYDGVLIMGTIAANNAGNYIKAQQGTDGTVSDAADLAGSKVVCTAANQVVFIDLVKPQERYVKAIITRGASTATGDLYAIQYRGIKSPVSNVRTGYNGTLLQSPDEGTA